MADSSSVAVGPKLGKLIYADIGAGFVNSLRTFFRAFDQLVQCTVKSRTTTAPPGSPADGDAYIVPTGATGAWSSNVGKLAVYSAQIASTDLNVKTPGWEYYTPRKGWRVYSEAEDAVYKYTGTAWVLMLGNIAAATIGATTTLDASAAATYTVTLTQSTTIAITNPVDGQRLTILFKQDGTGSRTVGWPADVVGGGVVSAGANSRSSQSFVYSTALGNVWVSAGAMQTGM